MLAVLRLLIFLKNFKEKIVKEKERQLYLLNFEPGKNLQKPAVDLEM